MESGFSDEEAMLENVIGGFLSGDNGVPKFRSLLSENKTFAKDTWDSLKEMGWPGLIIDNQYDGSEMGVLASCIVADKIGRNLSLIPFISSAILSATAIQTIGTVAQKQDWLPPLSSGVDVTAIALESRNSVILVNEDGCLTLSGYLDYVIDGNVATHILVLITLPKNGLALVRIQLAQDGIDRIPLRSIDGRDIARITFAGVPINAFDFVGDRAVDAKAIEAIRAYGALIYAAEQMGCAKAAFHLTLSYLKERSQFGQIIGSFQALQHRAAILYSELSLAEALIVKAADRLQTESSDAIRFCSLAKAKAGQAARLITNEAIQLHGGIGMTDEYDVGLYVKRVAVSERLFGDYNFHADKAAHLAGY
jgi:acyl-CoA dehydrogenase